MQKSRRKSNANIFYVLSLCLGSLGLLAIRYTPYLIILLIHEQHNLNNVPVYLIVRIATAVAILLCVIGICGPLLTEWLKK